MKCSICGIREAVFRIEQVVGGERTEISLCEECERKKGIRSSTENIEFSISGLLSSLGNPSTFAQQQRKNKRCPRCGLTYQDLRKNARLGCCECYSIFRREIRRYAKRHFGSTQHVGKYPRNLLTYKTFLIDRERLERQLREAVALEEYEKAAELRDKIRNPEKHPEDK